MLVINSDPGSSGNAIDWRTLFGDSSCDRNAIFAGTVTSVEILPTESGSFLFSDITVMVSEVLRLPPGSQLAVGRIATVTRPGGVVTINKHKVGVQMSGFPDLEAEHEYLFLTKRLPRFDTFDAESSLDVFEVRNGKAFSFTANNLNVNIAHDGLALPTIRSAVGGAKCK
jgi:hypothetical protein